MVKFAVPVGAGPPIAVLCIEDAPKLFDRLCGDKPTAVPGGVALSGEPEEIPAARAGVLKLSLLAISILGPSRVPEPFDSSPSFFLLLKPWRINDAPLPTP